MYIFMDRKYKVLQQANLRICLFLKHLCRQLVFSDLIVIQNRPKTISITCFSIKSVLYFIQNIFIL